MYNGHNKTFFFFNYEEFLETALITNSDTVPAPAYLQGNFSAISPNGTCSLCAGLGIPTKPLGTPNTELDPLGNTIFANEIFDPLTRAVATSGSKAGQGYATPFPGNIIPTTRFDPVTVNFLNLLQKLNVTSQNSNLTGNYLGAVPSSRYSVIPSFKIDHNLSAKDKLSFYYQETNLQDQVSVGAPQGADGLPLEIGQYRGTFITGWVERLNYDRTLTPTLLLHFGVGYYYTRYSDKAAFTSFNPSQFGLTGFVQDRQFPSITGMSSTYGGMQTMGTLGQIQSLYHDDKPSFNASATWVRGKHTYKLGSDVYLQGSPPQNFAGVTLATRTNATADPFTPVNSLNGFSTGCGAASWLLGDYNSTTQTAPNDTRMGYQQWALYLQDSWKVTSKLTVDYGLRWDLGTTPHEQYGRLGQLDETLANGNAGGHPGPQLRQRWLQVLPASSLSLRDRTAGRRRLSDRSQDGASRRMGDRLCGDIWNRGRSCQHQRNLSRGRQQPVVYSRRLPIREYRGSGFDRNAGFSCHRSESLSGAGHRRHGTSSTAPVLPDANQNRPPRTNQYSVGVQREITRNFTMEAAYVANRVVWLGSGTGVSGGPAGPLGNLSRISPQMYAAYGLYPYPGTGPCATGGGVCLSSTYNNNNDRNLLSQSISSAAVIQNEAAHGITNLLPYSGFPASTALTGILYPFPQFGALNPTGSATGNSKYDSLQMKATKRLSHGLQAGGAYTWAKGFTRPARQDFFNPASNRWALQNIPPESLSFNFTYTVPKAPFLNKWENLIVNDWQIGGYALYQAAPILRPQPVQRRIF